METSIVIITWNQKEKLTKCLETLINNCNMDNSEIIIIDNNSNDGTKEFLISEYSGYTLIFNESNLGVAKARNTGLKLANGKYIVFLDDDTIILNDFIKKSINYLNTNKEVYLLGPKLFFDNGEIQPSARKFPSILGILGRAFPKLTPKWFSEQYLYSFIYSKEPINVEWVIGACQFIRRDAIKIIGLLDEKYFFGYEDVDYCHRIKNAGYSIVYHPDVSLVHSYQRKSAQKLISKMKVYHILSIMRYYFKCRLNIIHK